jgi:vanillate O-demethylase ferredoxin subunit
VPEPRRPGEWPRSSLSGLGGRLELSLSEEGRQVDIAAEIARLDPEGEFDVCGPIGMLEEAKRCWRSSGRPIDRLRFETFGSSGEHPSAPFVVEIPRLGKEIAADANQTMLEALEEANVAMIFDCRRGECALCALPILAADGIVDHRDVFFSDAEKAQNLKLCTCVSRVYGASITVDTADR